MLEVRQAEHEDRRTIQQLLDAHRRPR
jgi:hypothetical protein